jgi:hypothetical protein
MLGIDCTRLPRTAVRARQTRSFLYRVRVQHPSAAAACKATNTALRGSCTQSIPGLEIMRQLQVYLTCTVKDSRRNSIYLEESLQL